MPRLKGMKEILVIEDREVRISNAKKVFSHTPPFCFSGKAAVAGAARDGGVSIRRAPKGYLS
jgi:hypothetical protein